MRKKNMLDIKSYNVQEPTMNTSTEWIILKKLQKILQLIPHLHGILLLTWN